jgi:hypothetical protein
MQQSFMNNPSVVPALVYSLFTMHFRLVFSPFLPCGVRPIESYV